MVLIDKGLKNGMEFGHTDYDTGEGRFITKSENLLERYVNPELTYVERKRISKRDHKRRNLYGVGLHCENNTLIIGYITYNPITEALSFSWSITGHHGKKVRRLN